MRFSNPEIPEDGQKKLSAMSQIREGGRLGFLLLVIIGVLALLFFYAGSLFGKFVPFAWEKKITVVEFFPLSESHPPEALAKEQALQALADKLAAGMDLDPEITITVHYRDTGLVNAKAGFAGNIYVFEGLLEKLQYEEEVAALLAHEIGHVKERHLMQGLSANILLGITFFILSGESGATDSLGKAVLTLEAIQFTRSMEEEADDEALKAVGGLYGGVGGFVSLFQAMVENGSVKTQPYQFLLTHPYADKRVARANEFAGETGVGLDTPTTPWGGGEE